MLTARFIFQERAKEIETYVHFLKLIEIPRTRISYENTRTSDKGVINNDVKNILKANIYLLVYNVVEVTVRNVFEDIYESLKINAVKFEDLCDKFKLEILKDASKNLKTVTLENINEKIVDMSTDIIHVTFNVKSAFNGNVDARLIKEKVAKIGLSIISTQYSGYDLLSIKDQRNSLAHGDISFCDCGRDLSLNEIIPMLIRVRKYMETFLDCAEEYISKQLYRKNSPK